MANVIDFAEVAQHKSKDSCWVILYGNVWDVTDFLSEHPGGANIILKLSGQDATEEYDPIHPPGTLEENLDPAKKLGVVDPKTVPVPTKAATDIGPEANGMQVMPVEHMLNLDEFEAAAKAKMSKKGWAYYHSAADDAFSKSFNGQVYQSILLRPRVFVDCTHCNLSTTFLGYKLDIPIAISPAAMARLAHPDGEWGLAQAARKFGTMQLISNNASMTPEQIVKDADPTQIFGWQLYVQSEKSKSEDYLARINRLSAIKFVCLTLDAPVPGKREEDQRAKHIIEEDSAIRDASGAPLKAAGAGSIGESLFAGTDPSLTWTKTLPWLKRNTNKPIILKGLQTHEDAYIAAQHFPHVKGIVLSNHGGRASDTAPPAIHTLLEIRKYCPEVLSKLDIMIDGGIRRGTDVVKALALGAKVVGIGRAPLFGLAAGGIEGVERTLDILRSETATAMRLLGASTVPELGPHHVNTRAVERDIYDGPANIPGLEKRGLSPKARL